MYMPTRVMFVCAGLTLAITGRSLGVTFTTLDFPGDVVTQLHGISRGTVLGTWYDFPNNTSGHFLFRDGSFTPLDLAHPDSVGAVIPWKLDGDTIVGWYFGNSFATRAFAFDGTNYETILLPASDSARAMDISGDVIVGTTSHSAGALVFRHDRQTTGAFGFPGEALTAAEAVSGATIVGSYGPAPESRGFIYDGSNWTTLEYPGAASTRPLGVSEAGIVGQFARPGFLGSFRLVDGVFSELRYPGSTITEVWDMEGNVIVGSYTDATGVHGFVATIPEPSTVALFAGGLCGMVMSFRRLAPTKRSLVAE